MDGDNFAPSERVFLDEFLYFFNLSFSCLRKIERGKRFDIDSQSFYKIDVVFDAVEISFFRAAKELDVVDKIFVFDPVTYL